MTVDVPPEGATICDNDVLFLRVEPPCTVESGNESPYAREAKRRARRLAASTRTGMHCIEGSGDRKVRKLMSLVLDLLEFVVGGLRSIALVIGILLVFQPDAVVRAGRLDESARGIAFVLAVEEVTGIVHREA